MPGPNEILIHGENSENVLSQEDYQLSGTRTGGFIAGMAKSNYFNKLFRQITRFCRAFSKVISDNSEYGVQDNGDITANANSIVEGLKTALNVPDISGLQQEFEGLQTTVNEHSADTVYQTAGGTATAITLTISGALSNGYPITFIASANNNGVATTINGKPLYKPNTTTAPSLVAGKAYTVWYNSASNCFFIKASAEGTASVGNVLAGKTFSNDNDTGLTGTMPNFAGSTKDIVNHAAAMSVYVDPSDTRMGIIEMPNHNAWTGYIDGTTRFKAQLWGLIPDNIRAGAIIGQYNGYGSGFMTGTYNAKRAVNATGTADVNGNFTLSGLSFTPKHVTLWLSGNPNIEATIDTYVYVNMRITYYGGVQTNSAALSGITINSNGFTLTINNSAYSGRNVNYFVSE